MDHDVEGSKHGSRLLDQRLDLLIGSNIAARHQRSIQLCGQRAGMPRARFTLVGEADRGALAAQRLRDPPGDRPIAGEADDQGMFSFEQWHTVEPSTLVSKSYAELFRLWCTVFSRV